jgi:REP-associated tyrosine transposase
MMQGDESLMGTIQIGQDVGRAEGRRLAAGSSLELHKRYWGRHFWAIWYGAWSTGNIIEEMVQEYLEHHRHASNKESETLILE